LRIQNPVGKQAHDIRIAATEGQEVKRPRLTIEDVTNAAMIESDRKERTLRNRIRHLENELATAAASAERVRKVNAVGVFPSLSRKRQKGDRIRVAFGDLHGCKANGPAVSALLSDIKMLSPDEIILGGDMTDCGGFLAQHHTMGYVAETDYTWEEDIAATNAFLDALQEAAPGAVLLYMEGNHENRVERWIITETLRHPQDARYLRSILGPHNMLRLKERGIRFYARNEQHGNCRQPGFIQRGKCFFVHEISSGRNAASTALNRVGGNVVFFHTHTSDSAIGFRPGVGNIGAWNPGCLCELRPMWQHTRPNDWTHGYAVQMVAANENFLHINVPIVDGQSLLIPFTKKK
jgi:hypothetical protein